MSTGSEQGYAVAVHFRFDWGWLLDFLSIRSQSRCVSFGFAFSFMTMCAHWPAVDSPLISLRSRSIMLPTVYLNKGVQQATSRNFPV